MNLVFFLLIHSCAEHLIWWSQTIYVLFIFLFVFFFAYKRFSRLLILLLRAITVRDWRAIYSLSWARTFIHLLCVCVCRVMVVVVDHMAARRREASLNKMCAIVYNNTKKCLCVGAATAACARKHQSNDCFAIHTHTYTQIHSLSARARERCKSWP